MTKAREYDEPGSVPAPKLLIDTNVWIDNYDGTRSGSRTARSLLITAGRCNATLLYPVHVIKDVYYILCATLKRRVRDDRGFLEDKDAAIAEEIAWGCVCSMRETATAVGADESDLWLAEKHHRLHRDLEDDLVLAAAIRAKADFLVTSDERLLRKATVAALTPEDMLAYLEGL